MIASAVTDLPLPDSPTSPTVWPGSTSKLTPSTAVNGRVPLRRNTTFRSRTSSSAIPYRLFFGSSASRRDSPSSVKPSATTMIAIAG